MNIITRWKKPLYIVAAAGVIGFAAYGVYHTVDAAQASAQNNDIVNVDTVNDDPSTGGCGPYGCAACSVCTVLQYQPNLEVTPKPQLEGIY